jgi:hypothetical protein
MTIPALEGRPIQIQDKLMEHTSDFFQVGSGHCRYQRLCAACREAVTYAERGAGGNGDHLDQVVLRDQASEPPVRRIIYCFKHRSNNSRLAAVNFFLAIVGSVQVSRILTYRRSLKGSTVEAIKEEAKQV